MICGKDRNWIIEKIITAFLCIVLSNLFAFYIGRLSDPFIDYLEMFFLFLLSLLIIIIFLITGKDHVMSDKTIYLDFDIFIAVILDSIIWFIGLVLIIFLAAAVILLLRIPIYNYVVEIFVLLFLSSNVFFTSPGYRIFRLFLPRYKAPVLFNNAFYIALSTVILKENNMIMGIIAGLYVSLDFLCILIKRKPLVCFIFKINIYHMTKK